MTIPIALLHHNEPEFLLRCVKAIRERTRVPCRLFVVDNASPPTDENIALFRLLTVAYDCVVILNPKNNWIFGFNLALNHPEWPDSPVFAFSDADVIVPEPNSQGVCWLGHMVGQLETYCCIGKLGLRLDLKNLEANPTLRDTFAREARYLQGERIGPNVVAPVDTTMALYRKDLYVMRFRFSIGHSALVKPYYYICRTSPDWTAVHLGWDHYPGGSGGAYPAARQWEKSFLMSKVGAFVDPAVLAQFPRWRRLLLQVIRTSVRLAFGIQVACHVLVYVLSRIPMRLNEIQARSR